MHADLVRGDKAAAARHAFRSIELSGQLLAREPEHKRGGAFHLRAATFAIGFITEPDDQSAAVALLERALAVVAGNQAIVENTAYMGFPYLDALVSRVILALYQSDQATALSRAAEARSLVERERHASPRSAEFSGWAASISVLEGWIALGASDVDGFTRAIERGFAEARRHAEGPDRRMHAATEVAGRVREILWIEGTRIVDAATLARLAEIRAWVVGEYEREIAEAERAIPDSASVLTAKAVRARLLGDERLADEFDARLYFSPTSSYQQAAGGPPESRNK